MVRNTTFRGYVYGDMDARHFHFAAVYRHEQGKDRRRNDNADKTQIGVFLTLVYVCLVYRRNFVFFNIAYAYSLWATLYVLLIVFIIKFRYEIHQLK